MDYRVNPLLLIYPAPISGRRRWIAEVSAGQPPLILHEPKVAWALSELPERFTAQQASETWSEVFDEQTAADLWEVALSEALVVPSQSPEPAVARFDAWAAYGWSEAASYHEATRDYPFVQMNEPDAFDRDRARMAAYVEQAPPPPIYQDLPAERHVALPSRLAPDASAEACFDALSEDERRGLPGLGLFFDLCFGERSTEPFDVQGRFLRKAIPSGGARHPTEVFFAAFERAPVAPGIYHYNVRNHRLDCVRDGDHEAALRRATFDLFQKFEDPPLGLVVFTSLVERAMWRYRDARSSRAVLVDVGHALMAYRTVAWALGFKIYTYQKIQDSALAEVMTLDRLREVPLFVGTLV